MPFVSKKICSFEPYAVNLKSGFWKISNPQKSHNLNTENIEAGGKLLLKYDIFQK